MGYSGARVPLHDGASPYKAKERRYPQRKQALLSTMGIALGKEKLVVNFSPADWMSAPLLVKTPPWAYYRVTTDLLPCNFATKKIIGLYLILELRLPSLQAPRYLRRPI